MLRALIALLLLAAHARRAPAAATPAARPLSARTRQLSARARQLSAFKVNNDARQAAALPPAVMNALHNGSTIKVTQSGLDIGLSAVISPLVPVDGATKGYTLTIPGDGPSCTIADVDVTVQWVKCDGGITTGGACIGTGPAGSNEISLDLRTVENFNTIFSSLVATGFPTGTYGSGPEPGASFTVTFDDQAAAVVGKTPDGSIANNGNPVDGTFRPASFPLSRFNGLEARGRAFELLVVDDTANDNPIALQRWQIDITCGEPTCDNANFIGYGSGTFWGPKTKPGTNTLANLSDPAIGGWPDECAKAFDACQEKTTNPTVFDIDCGCALWACLSPCFANECPIAGEGPICPPQDLRKFYCHALKAAGATCGDDAPPFPEDCESLAPAAAVAVAKRARRDRA